MYVYKSNIMHLLHTTLFTVKLLQSNNIEQYKTIGSLVVALLLSLLQCLVILQQWKEIYPHLTVCDITICKYVYVYIYIQNVEWYNRRGISREKSHVKCAK